MFRALDFPKGKEQPQFMTWAEIETRIARTKPDKKARKALWDCVFLDTTQVTEFLDWAEQKKARHPVPFFVPLLTAAHTGARVTCRRAGGDFASSGARPIKPSNPIPACPHGGSASMRCSRCDTDLVTGAMLCHVCGTPASETDGGEIKQENNAGNNGDRVKHTVVLHTLERAAGWGKIRYRETHAGAGFYPMNDESCELRQLVMGSQPPPSDDKASVYYRSLRSWWTADAPGYPGGIVQAARWLRHRRDRAASCSTFGLRRTPFGRSHKWRELPLVTIWWCGASHSRIKTPLLGCSTATTSFSSSIRSATSGSERTSIRVWTMATLIPRR